MKTTSENHSNICEPDTPTVIYSIRNHRTLVLFLFLFSYTRLIAQPGLTIYADIGSNNVSNGLFIKSATMGHFKFGKNRVEAGFQNDLVSNNNIPFSGYTINASRELVIKDSRFELQGFCTWTLNSEFLRETNWGALLKMRHGRFEMEIGTNSRTYAFREHAIRIYKIEKNSESIHENFNLMYSFSYYLKKTNDPWNVGLSITNIDYFIINQETNPVINLRGLYKPGPRVCLFTEFWYKPAGTLNLTINHFGFFTRTGMIWNFN